jgi:transcriptional regulator with GAF, ATPase, and Fis domain
MKELPSFLVVHALHAVTCWDGSLIQPAFPAKQVPWQTHLAQRPRSRVCGWTVKVLSSEVAFRSGPAPSSLQEARDSAEREQVRRALEENGWNVSAAARVLGVERTNLHKRIRVLGLKR